MPQQQQHNIQVDINTLPQLVCPHCKGKIFIPLLHFRKLSPLLTPGQPNGGIVTEQRIRCANSHCKRVLTPQMLQEEDVVEKKLDKIPCPKVFLDHRSHIMK